MKTSLQMLVVDASWKRIYRAGGVSILAFLGLNVIDIILSNVTQGPTSATNGAAALQAIAAHLGAGHAGGGRPARAAGGAGLDWLTLTSGKLMLSPGGHICPKPLPSS